MARPRKDGLDYFPFDVGFFSDRKIRIVKARFGADGIAIYIFLLCEIYEKGYYLVVDDDFLYIIADELNMSEDKVKQVLNFLLERSLFNSILFQSDKVLTSAGIQRRFQEAVKNRASKNPLIVKRFWLLEENETESFIKVRHNADFSEKNESYSEKNESYSEKNDIKKSKEKKSKEKEATGAACYFANPQLNEAFAFFLAYRRNNFKEHLAPETIALMIQELEKIGSSDEERIAVLNTAVFKGWKNFYPPDKKKKDKKSSGFNNFEARNYDYSDLEKELLERKGK